MTATVAPPSGNQFGVLLAIFLVITFTTVVVLWVHERRWDRNDEQLAGHDKQLAELAYQMPALLEYLGIEIPPPAADDSPEALAELEVKPDEMPTGPIEIAPETVPDGMPLAVQSALIEQRPSPVPRGKSAEWVEAELARFNFGGRPR